MLPKNKLRKRLVQRLKIYGEGQHPHAAQRPEPLSL
jgi:large subunit ribosomal protein L13